MRPFPTPLSLKILMSGTKLDHVLVAVPCDCDPTVQHGPHFRVER